MPHSPRQAEGLIIKANYTHRSGSELERIIAPLWPCMSVCVSLVQQTEEGEEEVTEYQVLMSQTDKHNGAGEVLQV